MHQRICADSTRALAQDMWPLVLTGFRLQGMGVAARGRGARGRGKAGGGVTSPAPVMPFKVYGPLSLRQRPQPSTKPRARTPLLGASGRFVSLMYQWCPAFIRATIQQAHDVTCSCCGAHKAWLVVIFVSNRACFALLWVSNCVL